MSEIRKKFLENVIREYSNLYEQGKCQISDENYDKLIEELKKIDPNNSLLISVGSPIIGSKKIKLPEKMGSLSEIKYCDGSIERWIRKHPQKTLYVLTQKLDGLSVLLSYRFKKISKGYTRGNGIEGKDITNHILYIPSIPKNINSSFDDVVIRGECIIKEKIFLEKYKDKGFKTSRNFVAGVINRDEPDPEILQDIDFVPYEIKSPEGSKLLQLRLLSKLGFLSIFFQTSDIITPQILKKILEEQKSISEYSMDGIVIDINSISTRNYFGFEGNTLNPEYAKCFKMRNSNNEFLAEVSYIEWNVSKNGFVKPRVRFDPPIDINGVKINWASGKNAKFIKEKGISSGSKVLLTRAGDAVPDIINIIERKEAYLPIYCPSCDSKVKWNETRVELICDNPECGQKKLKRISLFFTTIGVFGVSESRISILVVNGFDSVDKILDIKEEDIKDIDGFGKRSARNIVYAIRKACANVTLEMLIYASGFCGKNLGKIKLKKIIDKFGNKWILENCLNLDISEIHKKIKELNGFSDITSEDFSKGIKKFLGWFSNNEKFFNIKEDNKISKNLDGYNIVFTGFRDKNLENEIIENGGKVMDDVSKNVNLLVYKDINKIGNKYNEAIRLDITTLDLESFVGFLKENCTRGKI